MSYIGNQLPIPVPQGVQTRDTITAIEGQTIFNTSGYTPDFVDVYLNGVHLDASAYTATDGVQVVLDEGATAGDIFEMVAFSNFEITNIETPLTILPNYFESAQQLTGGNDPAEGFYSASSDSDERKTVNIPEMLLNIGGSTYKLPSAVTKDLGVQGSWDDYDNAGYTGSDATTNTNRAGQDFYVYACVPLSGTIPDIVISNNSTTPYAIPSGETPTESNTRKLGGFHCLCLSVGNITGHELINYATGDILPRSVWDAHKHRPESNPEGMIYTGNHLWVDIYLAATVNNELVSAYNAYPQSGGTDASYPNSPTPYYHWYNFVDRFAEVNKRLPVQSEFMRFALGSNEETNVTGSTFATKTTGGNVDTNSRRMISNFGVEDCAGALRQWVNETGHLGSDSSSYLVQDTAGTADSLDNAQSIGRGQGYQIPNRGIVGGAWNYGSICGSRSVDWHLSPLTLDASRGARGVSVSKF